MLVYYFYYNIINHKQNLSIYISLSSGSYLPPFFVVVGYFGDSRGRLGL